MLASVCDAIQKNKSWDLIECSLLVVFISIACVAAYWSGPTQPY